MSPSPAAEPPALAVKNLVVELGGRRVVDNISFSIDSGSTTAIIGPNGAGKSVLIKAILRLLPKEGGDVTLFGTPHEQYHLVAPNISYIPQQLPLDRDFPLTVRELFSLKSQRFFGITPEEETHMLQLLKRVNMETTLSQPIGELSGGQMQRILIAYSLIDHPKLLILDEPSAGIDTQGQETIYELLYRLQLEEKLTMILISHELDVVMQYADQVLCLNRSLLCAGIPRKVLTTEILERMYGTEVGHYHHTHHDT